MSGVIIHKTEPVKARVQSVELILSPAGALALAFLVGETCGCGDELDTVFTEVTRAFREQGVEYRADKIAEDARHGITGNLDSSVIIAQMQALIDKAGQ